MSGRRGRLAVLFAVVFALIGTALTQVGMYTPPAVFCGAFAGWLATRPFVRRRR